MDESTYVIYRCFNIKTGESYIGRTNNFKRRKSEHLKELAAGKHSNKRLQQGFNEHGIESFEWEVLEPSLPEDVAKTREYELIEQYDSIQSGYNVADATQDIKDLKAHRIAVTQGMKLAAKKGIHVGRPREDAQEIIEKYPYIVGLLQSGIGIWEISRQTGVTRITIRKIRDALNK